MHQQTSNSTRSDVGDKPVTAISHRQDERNPTDCVVELTWKSEHGEKFFEHCRALDITENGLAVECPDALPVSAIVMVSAPAFHVAALAQVRHCTWRGSIYVVGMMFLARTTTVQSDPYAADHYELLRLSPGAEPEAVERVYRKLAKRFHPDNPETGDAETFLRIAEAYRVLSDSAKRMEYDAERIATRISPRFQFRSAEFFSGVLGEQNRRLAILCLLYRKRTSNYEYPGLSLFDLEQLTGCTQGELGFSIWYNCEKGYARATDRDYCLTAEGVDFVEKKLVEDRGELLAIAAGSSPANPSIAQFFTLADGRARITSTSSF
jgi:curved DNA-binding protein